MYMYICIYIYICISVVVDNTLILRLWQSLQAALISFLCRTGMLMGLMRSAESSSLLLMSAGRIERGFWLTPWLLDEPPSMATGWTSGVAAVRSRSLLEKLDEEFAAVLEFYHVGPTWRSAALTSLDRTLTDCFRH